MGTPTPKRRDNQKPRFWNGPRILFGGGAIGLGLVTAWRNIEGRIASATNEAEIVKELVTGASMEAVSVGAAALAIYQWKHDRVRAGAMGLVAAFCYAANTHAASNNIAAQAERSINIVEGQGASASTLAAEIADLERSRDAIITKHDGHIPRDEETLEAHLNALGGAEKNPINASRAASEAGDRREYDRLTEEIAAKRIAKAAADVRANDGVHSTNDGFAGRYEILGMQAIQALAFWLSDTKSRHRPPKGQKDHPPPGHKRSAPAKGSRKSGRGKKDINAQTWAIIRAKEGQRRPGP